MKNGDLTKNKTNSQFVEHRSSNVVGTQRMGTLRNKFESGNLSEKKIKKKSIPKMKYDGLESVKTKFIEEASKSSVTYSNGPRQQKEFTPPPEGVAVGVLESNPQPRAPNVISGEDMYQPIDLSSVGQNTKCLRTKFRNLESGLNNNDQANKFINSYLFEIVYLHYYKNIIIVMI